MSESASEIAGSGGPHLSWWRRVILFVLEVNPPWWGSARLWTLSFMLLLLLGIVGTVHDSRRGSGWAHTLYLTRVNEHQWRPVDRPGRARAAIAEIEIYTRFKFSDRWRTARLGSMRGVLRSPGGGSRSITETEAREIVQDALAQLSADEFRRWAEKTLGLPTSVHDDCDSELWMQIVYEGRTEGFGGSRFWWFLARQSSRVELTALLGLLACSVVGFLRSVQRRTYEPPLALIAKGRCPQCRYDMTGAPARVCPECGTDVEAVEREARAALE